jgi:hypothetical protein
LAPDGTGVVENVLVQAQGSPCPGASQESYSGAVRWRRDGEGKFVLDFTGQRFAPAGLWISYFAAQPAWSKVRYGTCVDADVDAAGVKSLMTFVGGPVEDGSA